MTGGSAPPPPARPGLDRPERLRRVVFHRNFRAFSGGHLKVWDYFNHVRHSPRHEALVHFSPGTVWDASNPWLPLRAQGLASWAAGCPDVLFLAGLDWLILDAAERRDPPVSVINLIQHLRHGDPDDPRHAFLAHPAVRICVSEEIREAIAATGRVNGPVFVIPNGIDTGELFAAPPREPSSHVLIAAVKQPELGWQLEGRLRGSGRRLDLLTASVPRPEFLARMRAARVTAFLPGWREGFYLPALEGMAVGTLVVCPDCVGNRGFCAPGENCFRPEYTLDAIEGAVTAALRLAPDRERAMLDRARVTAGGHELSRERRAFLDILKHEKL